MEAGQDLLGIEDIGPLLNKPWIDFWQDKEDRAAARSAVQAAAAGEEGSFVGFFRTLRDEPKWWDVAISPILGADGQPARLLAVSRDVTERRSLEESLVEARRRSGACRPQQGRVSRHARARAAQSARTAAQCRARSCKPSDASAEERAQAQRIIDRQIENMSRMIDDLLDVSRITEGKIELRKKPVALEAILTAADQPRALRLRRARARN